MSDNVDINVRSGYDSLLTEIAQYVSDYDVNSDLALETAKNCLIDTVGCGLLALTFPACTKMLGPVVHGTEVPHGVRVPGTNFSLDPVKGAFDFVKNCASSSKTQLKGFFLFFFSTVSSPPLIA